MTVPVTSNLASLRPFLPETVLMIGTLAAVVVGLVRRRPGRRGAGVLAIATCLGALLAMAVTAGPPVALFGGLLRRDRFADYFKLVFLIATMAVAALAQRARDTIQHDDQSGGDAHELYALLLAGALAMCLMAAASDLLLAYLSLEFLSIVSYILAGFARGARRSAEASLKYVIYGGVASGAMLYGMSLLYGLAASTDLAAVRAALVAAPPLTAVIAVTLLMAGLGFKIAAVPFHMWAPDVYEGAPTPVSAFLAVASKAAGFALILRFFGATPGDAEASLQGWMSLFFIAASVATMTLGNLAALGQTNLKRLLAYSSIAHAGYLLMAVAAGTPAAGEAALFYVGVYLFMNLAAFAVVLAVADRGGGETIADYAGLGYRAPVAALCMTVALFSLTGLPPFAGFIGKYTLFAAVVARGLQPHGAPFLLLAVVGVLNSVVSLFYYARVLKAMYLERVDAPGAPLPLSRLHTGMLAVLTLPTILLGIYWSPLSALAAAALR